ncbi:hypothetical protein CCM_04780 [Cordyceps militaris CM01]|uniref:Uncharacterized protein n=1 Tax=Cordyceps militaris (strain CM01) TaxID=983644 RepID=G3JEK9_CORMM|nr:uncharacterized protein CCM_04780 [Cordyceps militaris CM01]EGX93406.1 hypothetical protein CCM_04780 [Cordyceps militaris CM01]
MFFGVRWWTPVTHPSILDSDSYKVMSDAEANRLLTSLGESVAVQPRALPTHTVRVVHFCGVPSGYGADGAENNVCLYMCFREVSLCCLRAWPSLAVNYCVCQYRNALGACILASTTWRNRRAQAHGSLICPLMAT